MGELEGESYEIGLFQGTPEKGNQHSLLGRQAVSIISPPRSFFRPRLFRVPSNALYVLPTCGEVLFRVAECYKAPPSESPVPPHSSRVPCLPPPSFVLLLSPKPCYRGPCQPGI
jgi:hypothetical protein